MAKVKMAFTDYFPQVMDRLRDDGLLLLTQGNDGKPNPMTIGWGTIGSVWGLPMFVVLVRPSRYSYTRLEENGDFTVNVPTKGMADAALHCGTISGRDQNKLADLKLTVTPAQKVSVPIIEECVVHYECRTVQRNDVVPEALAQKIDGSAYASGDYHRIYYGQILAAYADEDAAQRLGGDT